MAIDERDVGLELFLDWLAEARGRQFEMEERLFGGVTARCSDGKRTVAVEVRPLLDISEDEVWQAYRRQLEEEIAVDLPGAFALWLPPGANLPMGSGEARPFRQQVREVAVALQPGQRGQLARPIKLYLRKTSEEGSLMSVVGGLDPYWARMSERVRGSFDLDSTALHRLSESEEQRQELVDRVCAEAGRIERLGHWQAVDASDVWTIQRLQRGQGFLIVGVPPQLAADSGIAVRRNLRRILSDAQPKLVAAGSDMTALVLLGAFRYADSENLSTALRGFDPGLYGGIDFICLAADGRLKPIIA